MWGRRTQLPFVRVTARYDADGTLVRQTLPGELTATTITDGAGDPVSLAYTKPGVAGDWLRSTAVMTGFDQVDSFANLTATGTGGSMIGTTSRYGYDNLGRLRQVIDTAEGSSATCTRAYAFDVNSNRTGLTQTASAGAPANTCPAGIAASDSYGYDNADRLQAGPAGSPRASLRYTGSAVPAPCPASTRSTAAVTSAWTSTPMIWSRVSARTGAAAPSGWTRTAGWCCAPTAPPSRPAAPGR